MRYLLDTNICIYIINQRPIQVMARFRLERIGEIGISSLTAAELDYGVEKSGSARNRQALEKFLAPLEIVAFDDMAFRQYGRLRADLEKRSLPIGSMDMLIASHALALNAVLVTNNTREFERIGGPHLENWVA
ncbi:MAG: type II toxin-antitoxin system VapC family toxin [Pseudomonadota bacterium]|nr:type II toxin-antitoxin system VapC family toxin [Pseudomonadota bacterium]